MRTAIGLALMTAIAVHVGAEPFIQGLTAVSPPAIGAALLLAAVATAAASWRWRVIAARLGVGLGWTEAATSYYRSQFLNTVLPGGVLGDVDRAVSHGRSTGQIAQASRAVAIERSAGMIVQLVIAAVALVSLGLSAYAPAVGVLLLVLVVASGAVVLTARASARVRAVLVRELAMLRVALGDLRTLVTVSAASTVVVACHVATFVVACLAVGVAAGPVQLAAVALIAVVAASIPLNLGGWGPREGAAAWAFSVLGLGTATGIAASTAFGVLAMIAVAPGLLVVAASALRRRRARARSRDTRLVAP
ncbi:lysylphosphatidylglycerol synthase transmembrane domain-containing protein [Microbacterium rhizomatis]|uniref:Flippase-like domain-containing protein n=1 Tax=Microbacterium rhizomatis TaxID=1631477 RepID=A0A5J5J0F0_9MICO|nr:lysylphosphatidylglycerol synthase transmembrane domain-containing protein [Microbacterium rhizomatis]KAA9107807.1 flippase-like domain-containing protein [Microbacterium rhizomatis]